jgi:sugar phosphate isomerase/epimerase
MYFYPILDDQILFHIAILLVALTGKTNDPDANKLWGSEYESSWQPNVSESNFLNNYRIMKRILNKFIAGATLLIVLILNVGCQQQPQPLVPDPGVVSWSFRNQFAEDIPGTLDLIKMMGITNIEFSSFFGLSAAEMRQLIDERGMECRSYGVGYNDIVNNIEQVAKDAHTIGAKYVRVASIPRDGLFTLELAQEAVRDFNLAGKFLRAQGLFFCYHNHGFEFVPYQDGTLFDYMVQNTDPDYVSFEIDAMWVMHPGHDPVELLERYPERFRLMHLRDLKKGVVGDLTGRTDAQNDVIVGTGQVDFPTLLKAAQKTNIEYYYIEDGHPDVVTRVPQSRAYIMGITENKK